MSLTTRLAIYDPQLLTEDDFLRGFIARRPCLERQGRHILNNINATLTRHRLIIGQRGMGKTALLRRVAIAVRDNKALHQHWIPLSFREEQYNIAQLQQLWANCADALSDWCEDQQDRDSMDQLRRACDAAEPLWPVIQAVADKHQRRLLLLVDNLQLILDNLSDADQWAWRDALQARNGPMLLACSPTLPSQLTDRDGAFYEFFSLETLRELTAAELHSHLRTLADNRGDAGHRVHTQLDQHPQRVDVLHTLCGGSPRTLTLIYHVLEQLPDQPTPGIAQVLEAVLEHATPLYKARTEALSPQQRRIVDAIGLHWDPTHSSAIHQATGLAPSNISPQIKRLEEDGLIDKVPLDGKRKGYQLVERSYATWYLMRHGNRRTRKRLHALAEFLEHYHSTQALAPHARQLLTHGSTPEAIRNAEHAYRDALDAHPKDANTWDALGNLHMDCLKDATAARDAWQTAINADPKTPSPHKNRAWADLLAGDPSAAITALTTLTLPPLTHTLLQAGIAVANGNPGEATEHLRAPLTTPDPALWRTDREDLLRLTRLFKHHHFDPYYLDWLHDQDLHLSAAPYVAAVRAFYLPGNSLRTQCPEIRHTAEPMVQWLENGQLD